MKLRRVLLGALALVVLAGGAALYLVYASLDQIVKSAIEEYGRDVVGAQVRVGSVRISPTTGEGTIRGLAVANPDGFPTGDAFTLGEITLALDVTSLASSPVVVRSVVIGAPTVYAVMAEDGRTNLDVLRKNAERYAGPAVSGPAGSGNGEGDGLLIRIDRFTFTDGSVSADLPSEQGAEIETRLPEIDLRSVGGASGSPPDEIGRTIVVAFTRAVAAAVARAGAEALIDEHLEGESGEAAKQLLRRFLR
jgi:hypothetical protein